jgi:type 1 glutamine amidotransferase
MKKALIIWGGWGGHHPESTAKKNGKMLEENNFCKSLRFTCYGEAYHI